MPMPFVDTVAETNCAPSVQAFQVYVARWLMPWSKSDEFAVYVGSAVAFEPAVVADVEGSVPSKFLGVTAVVVPATVNR